jgi:hypothetical protein
MDSESSGQEQGEERRRRVKKKRRVTRVTVDGKEVTGDFLKNPASLEFPDPGKRFRKYLVAGIIAVVVILSALLFLKISDWVPTDTGPPTLNK